jgi:osmoprotectant transport system permease protein
MRLFRVDPVLATLLACAIASLLLFPVLTHAPNRLLSGHPVPLADLAHGAVPLLRPAGLLLAVATLARRHSRAILKIAGVASLAVIGGLLALAGSTAASLVDPAQPGARTSIGWGLWACLLACALIWTETVRRLVRAPALRTALGLLAFIPPAVLLANGSLSDVSLLVEYRARSGTFDAAVLGHLRLVGLTLAFALPIGLALGLIAQRRAAWRGPVFAVLNIVQTIPSIALFGLLIAPLAGIGLAGIGTPPALIALTLYALLPVARTTASGLDGVPQDARDAARGMGMTPRQTFLHVDMPLALPSILTGIRVTAVQTIGLAVIAALIGAGGLGAILFQGLFANALDVVILAVIPVVVLAALADAVFGILAELAAVAAGRPA